MKRDFSKLTDDEGKQIVEDAFKVLFARYKLASSLVDIVTLRKEEVTRERVQVRVNFLHEQFVNKEDIM
jgi:hypothetical protein